MSHRLARRLRLASSPATWTALIDDARWRRSAPCPAPPVDGLEGPSAVVRWPISYQHPNAISFARPIKVGLQLVASVVTTEIVQPYEGIILIEIDPGTGFRRVAIDYFDFTFINERCAEHTDAYFKLQHLRGGYDGFPNVHPGGYITSSSFLYEYWCRLRVLRSTTPAIADVFGRFGLRYSADVRRSAIERLRSDSRLRYLGGETSTKHTRYLREMATSRVCVDMPGQGPFCYRLVECLAMGCCIIGPRHAADLPVELRNGIEMVYCSDDLSDLADLCATYAADATRRVPIEAAAAQYFDATLHPAKIAQRYVDTLREDIVRS